MCGIAGIFDLEGRRQFDVELLERMNAAQWHRGPDDGACHLEAGVGLAHRRLAIIDGAGSRQPMHSADGRAILCYNGEVYNFVDLRRELDALGYVFRTRGDTEVVLAAWQAWGVDCVSRFRGMFALAIYDRDQQALFLARDRLGVKPLHYAFLEDGTFVFASELKALLVHSAVGRQLDAYAIEDYFALGYVPEPRTIFAPVRKLPAANVLLLQRGACRRSPRKYWDMSCLARDCPDEHDASRELLERLREAVRMRLVADVPVGALLSGGLDSSTIVALMCEVSNEPVRTRTIGFDRAKYDESGHAAVVARHFSTSHLLSKVDQDDLDQETLDRMAAIYDEPFADSSALPTWRLCGLARRDMAVALSGDGSDEMLAGYRRLRHLMWCQGWRQRLPASLRRNLFGMLGRLYPKLDWAPRPLRARSTFEQLALDPVEAFAHAVSITPAAMRQQLFCPALRRQLGGYDVASLFSERLAGHDMPDPLATWLYLDTKTHLIDDINVKLDRASMSHSLELRQPFLDHPLIEWIAGLPSTLKLRRGRGKWLLYHAMESRLPAGIAARAKQGFEVPLASWMRGGMRPWLYSALQSSTLSASGLFDMHYIKQMLEAHDRGVSDFSRPLWALLIFESFLRRYS
jgi:asparagine synthase (glutamine-hydrolysing)